MKTDSIEVTARTAAGEPLRIVVDLFYREVLIHRCSVDPTFRQAIGGRAIRDMALLVSGSLEEADEIIRFVFTLMDEEGKNIMRKENCNIKFGVGE